MDLKHTLTFFGLLSDLLGAALLSIPMIWDTRAAAHSILKTMKRIKFWLYGYTYFDTRNSRPILSKDVQEAHTRIGSIAGVFTISFGIIAFRLIAIFSSSGRATALPFGSSPSLVTIGLSSAVLFTLLFVYFLGKSPLYLARALMWIARGNHERKIGFVGLGILCVGFILQAAVNLM